MMGAAVNHQTDTSTPEAARAHARSQAGASAPTTQTIPASAAVDLPVGVTGADVVWDETIPTGGYASRVLKRGVTLRITDLDGEACIGLLAYNANRPVERLSVADTSKIQWNAYLGEHKLLLSDMGRVLLSITEDTSGSHDLLCGASPAARDLFLLALSKHGMNRADLMPNVNLFAGVRVEEDGGLTFVPSRGGAVALRTELDVLIVIANSPHVLDPDHESRNARVRLLAHRTPPPTDDDPCRTVSPEAVRAFENTDDELLS